MGRPPRITRARLLDVSRRVFAEKGFDGTTLADIAAELDVTAAAILRHVDSKQRLFAEAMGGGIRVPPFIEELEKIDPAADPRVVLRHIAESFIPFAQSVIAENIVLYMHARRSFVVPFDVSSEESPPRRGLRIVTQYFRRAAKAGTLRVKDPRAAALLFMGSLHSYVFFHQILNVAARPYPLGAYIDALLDLWTSGAISQGGRRGS